MGLEPLDTGRIEIDGHALNYEPKTKPSRQDVRRATAIVGMVFQQFNLFPHMTVLDNLITAPIHALGDAHGPAPLLVNRFQQLVRGSGGFIIRRRVTSAWACEPVVSIMR